VVNAEARRAIEGPSSTPGSGLSVSPSPVPRDCWWTSEGTPESGSAFDAETVVGSGVDSDAAVGPSGDSDAAVGSGGDSGVAVGSVVDADAAVRAVGAVCRFGAAVGRVAAISGVATPGVEWSGAVLKGVPSGVGRVTSLDQSVWVADPEEPNVFRAAVDPRGASDDPDSDRPNVGPESDTLALPESVGWVVAVGTVADPDTDSTAAAGGC